MPTTKPSSQPISGPASSSSNAPAPNRAQGRTSIKGNLHYESEIQSLHRVLASLSVDPEPKLKNAKTDIQKQDYYLRCWARQRRAKLVERLHELESGWIEIERVGEEKNTEGAKEKYDKAYAEYLARKARMEAEGRVGR